MIPVSQAGRIVVTDARLVHRLIALLREARASVCPVDDESIAEDGEGAD